MSSILRKVYVFEKVHVFVRKELTDNKKVQKNQNNAFKNVTKKFMDLEKVYLFRKVKREQGKGKK